MSRSFKLPHTGLYKIGVGLIGNTFFEGIFLSAGIVVEVTYLIETVGNKAVELANRLAFLEKVGILVETEACFVELARTAYKLGNLVLVVSQGKCRVPLQITVGDVDRVDCDIDTGIAGSAGIDKHGLITRTTSAGLH